MVKKTLILGSCLMLALCCATPKKLMNNKTVDRLYFGNSGGFTNTSLDYVLIDYSVICKIEHNNLKFVKKLTGKQSESITRQIQILNIDRINLNEPGNMTYYLRLSKQGVDKEVKWSSTSSNEAVKELYTTLMSIIKP